LIYSCWLPPQPPLLQALKPGNATWGWGAAIVLALGGLFIGTAIGRIPQAIALRALSRHLRRCDTATLREKLRSEPYLSHFIVQILRSRGEPETELQERTLLLLLSESKEERWQAWRTVNLCFPDLAVRLRGIEPRKAPQRYEGLVRQLLEDLGFNH
jgi:hypothetical protein